MTTLFTIGGFVFLGLGLLLLLASVISFFLSRRSRAAAPPPQPSYGSPARPGYDVATAPTVAVNLNEVKNGRLRGISGALSGRTIPLTDEGAYIGRDAAYAQYVIDNVRVSKRHVWVGIRGGRAMVVDQSSTNGTFINRKENRVTEAELAPGDTLIVSDDVARLVYER